MFLQGSVEIFHCSNKPTIFIQSLGFCHQHTGQLCSLLLYQIDLLPQLHQVHLHLDFKHSHLEVQFKRNQDCCSLVAKLPAPKTGKVVECCNLKVLSGAICLSSEPLAVIRQTVFIQFFFLKLAYLVFLSVL